MTSGRMFGWVGGSAVVAGMLAAATQGAAAPCGPAWTPGFQAPGTSGIRTMVVFDPPGEEGASLYASMGGHIGKWDGTQWSEVSGSVNGDIKAMVVFDDGSGPALYVGGGFDTAGGVPVTNIARWNGAEWSAVGSLVPGVQALAVADRSGTGGRGVLYAAGSTKAYAYVAEWNGTEWSVIDYEGSVGIYMAMRVFDPPGEENGPALYVASGRSVNRWDGAQWTALEGWMNDSIACLEVFDPPGEEGPGLYAGGGFTLVGETPVHGLARWDGEQWAPAGDWADGDVRGMMVFDPPGSDGEAVLYAAGSFSWEGGAGSGVTRFDGAQWTAMGTRLDSEAFCLAMYDSGNGARLYVSGNFKMAGSLLVNGIAQWSGTEWVPLGNGMSPHNTSDIEFTSVKALTTFDPPGEEEQTGLYVGGGFGYAGGVPANSIARWDGRQWSALGDGIAGYVRALAVFDPPGTQSGAELYAGGAFSAADGAPGNNIAKWDGTAWAALGSGTNDSISAMAVFDPPGEQTPALYVGGHFTTAGDVTASSIAKWDGVAWSAVGEGIVGYVWVLTVYDDGTGPALYAAGNLTAAGSVTVNNIAKWDGNQWQALGEGVNDLVCVLAVFDPPGADEGPALYAGGVFTLAGGQPVNRIAKWDGTQWSAVGSGVEDDPYWRLPSVTALTVFDDGSGEGLYVGGSFLTAGGISANGIVKWDGTMWSALGSGIYGGNLAFCAFDPPGSHTGPALYAGGSFAAAGGVASARIARWGRQTVREDLDCDADVDGFDFLTFANCFNGPGRTALAACENTAADIDADGDVDGFDFLTFANCYNGSDRSPICP